MVAIDCHDGDISLVANSGLRSDRYIVGSNSRALEVGNSVSLKSKQPPGCRICGQHLRGVRSPAAASGGSHAADDADSISAPLANRWNRPRTAIPVLGSCPFSRTAACGHEYMSRWDLCDAHRHQGTTRLARGSRDPGSAGCLSEEGEVRDGHCLSALRPTVIKTTAGGKYREQLCSSPYLGLRRVRCCNS